MIWLHVEALVWLARKTGRSSVDTRRLARRELEGVRENMEAHRHWMMSEKGILNSRLSRRFDLGLALNESAQGAMEDKKVARESPVLSSKQLAALEVQKSYLQRIVKKS